MNRLKTHDVAGYPQYHLVGHPDQNIQHWIPIRGYDNYGDTTYYADPASGASSISWSSSVPKYSGISTNMLSVILTGRGYVW